jgi:hypothetical protein
MAQMQQQQGHVGQWHSLAEACALSTACDQQLWYMLL